MKIANLSSLTPAGASREIFVRYGELPPAHETIITDEFGGMEEFVSLRRSYNHRDEKFEVGVSCLRAVLTADGYAPDMAGVDSISVAFCASGRPLIVVEGVQIATGSDGEPIIAGDTCRVISNG